MAKVILNGKNFEEEVLKSEQPVLVDFWAAWCGPCRMVGPTVEQIAKEYNDKIKVGKLNVDEHQEVAAKYGVMSIPTFMIFKKGKTVSQFVGAQPKEKFVEEINKVLE